LVYNKNLAKPLDNGNFGFVRTYTMKNLLGKIIGLLLVYFLNVFSILAQDTVVPTENSFKKFQSINVPLERFQLFFETPNRYNLNSAYDWLDTVNIYLNTAEKTQDSLSITQYKLIQAQIYYDLGNYDRSLAIAKEIKNQVEELDLDTKEILFDLMDRDYAQLGLYTEQIEIRKEKKALGLTDNVAFYDIYSNLGLHRKAMIDYIESVQKTIDEKDYFAQAEFYNNVGTYLRLDKSIPTALTNYKKAKGFIDVYLSDVTKVKSENDLHEAHFLNSSIEGNIGKCHVQLELYKEAIPFLEESVKGMAESKKGAFSSEIIENRLALAECFLQLGDLKEATDYLSDNIQPKMTANLIKKNRLLSIYYDLLGDYKNSSLYLKKNIRINDSLSINESELRKQQLGTVMAEEKANTRSIMDAQKLALEQQRNEMIAKDEQISLVFISLIFTLLGFAGLVYAYLKSIKNQRLIAEQKHIIEKALVEKDSLLKEIHHRVKNNLQMVSSLLSLQTKNTRSKAAIEALEEGKSRVKAMALIHQKLYQNDDLSVIEMQGYIESLINSVQSVYKKGGHNINITIDAEGIELDIDRAIPFGLILNELVSNSFKYAFPVNDENGKIYIHLRKIGEKEGFFEYTDNGVGLPEDTDERANSSMGIRLMNRLANQLQTKLNIDRTSEGVRFWFNFA
jgi:two-component sensor histidine kinase